jgi:hypothetical protein
MYSGSTLTKYSGRVLGAHQKIDRVARKHLSQLLADDNVFPSARRILQFEGKNGPDAIKRKSPAKDEPWHYYSPFDEDDFQLLNLIDDHYKQLVKELKNNNNERVAFEAAWLAHALVDGLTPAHHYPYEEKLIELRGGEGIETRTTIKGKLLMPGETRRQKMKNNWKMWGPKGLFTTHGLFEMGVATLIMPLNFAEAVPNAENIKTIEKIGLVEWFKRVAREIAVTDMYEMYYHRGWTPKLAYQIRHKLGPTVVQTVTLAWYSALIEAGVIESNYENRRRHTRRKTVRKP